MRIISLPTAPAPTTATVTGALNFFIFTFFFKCKPPYKNIKSVIISPLKDFGNSLGMISEDEIPPGPANAGEDFQNDFFFVNPAGLCRSLDHGVFARNIVGGHGNIKFIF